MAPAVLSMTSLYQANDIARPKTADSFICHDDGSFNRDATRSTGLPLPCRSNASYLVDLVMCNRPLWAVLYHRRAPVPPVAEA